MSKRVAVITDANSSGYWFPKWHHYYSCQFGASALYVVTYKDLGDQFRNYKLGGLWELPHGYNDLLRAQVISSLVGALLESHDVVLRCDVDEFLVPDLREYGGLGHYIEKLSIPYVTARGIDVFENPGENKINMDMPVLCSQRLHAVMHTALHKTSVTTIPMRWGAGFHGANSPPTFDKLYLFHMKLADTSSRRALCQTILLGAIPDTNEYRYFSSAIEHLDEHQIWLSRKPSSDAWSEMNDDARLQTYLGSVQASPEGIQHGKFESDGPQFVIPMEFNDIV